MGNTPLGGLGMMAAGKRKVVVLLGGTSNERDVSLVGGEACAKALERLGHEVVRLDPKLAGYGMLFGRDDVVVFNGLHGVPGEDGAVQGLLESLGLAYTHSGVNASSVAMNKQQTRILLSEAGLPVAKGMQGSWAELTESAAMEFPFVLKPLCDGSSVGVYVVMNGDDWQKLPRGTHPADQLFLCEAYIDGPEYTVAVMDGRPLTVTEIRVAQGFYDYRAKYEEGGSQHICPADMPEDIKLECMGLAAEAHHILGCRGVSRTDFRLDQHDGSLYVLEINTQPGMTPTSLVPEQAQAMGISFDDLVSFMLEDASCGR